MRLIIYEMKNYEDPGGTGKLLNCKSQADWPFTLINLTNRFHVAVRLSSNRSQMTPKGGKNKEVAHEPRASVSLNEITREVQKLDMLKS